jgi:hypothetical protein
VLAKPTLDAKAAQCDPARGAWKHSRRIDRGRVDSHRQSRLASRWGDRDAQFSVLQLVGVLAHLIRRTARQILAVEGDQAAGEPLQVSVELDRRAVEDEHRLEDAALRIGGEADSHAGIS